MFKNQEGETNCEDFKKIPANVVRGRPILKIVVVDHVFKSAPLKVACRASTKQKLKRDDCENFHRLVLSKRNSFFGFMVKLRYYERPAVLTYAVGSCS